MGWDRFIHAGFVRGALASSYVKLVRNSFYHQFDTIGKAKRPVDLIVFFFYGFINNIRVAFVCRFIFS